jgi:hypothetical protein
MGLKESTHHLGADVKINAQEATLRMFSCCGLGQVTEDTSAFEGKAEILKAETTRQLYEYTP